MNGGMWISRGAREGREGGRKRVQWDENEVYSCTQSGRHELVGASAAIRTIPVPQNLI